MWLKNTEYGTKLFWYVSGLPLLCHMTFFKLLNLCVPVSQVENRKIMPIPRRIKPCLYMLISTALNLIQLYEHTYFRLGTFQAALSMKVGSSLLLSWYVTVVFTMCIFISNNYLHFRLEVWGLFLVLFPFLFWNERNKIDKKGLDKNSRSQSL